MLNNQTIEKLSGLKLPAMADCYRRLSESPDLTSLCHHDFIGMLIDAEWTARHNKRIKRLLRQAELRENASIEDIEYNPDRMLNRQQMLQFSECLWVDTNHNLLITGATGAGKTYIACALGNAACRRDISVRYYRMPRILTDLAVARLDGSYNRYLMGLKKCRLLIIDDWGIAPLSPAEGRDFLEVIEDRSQTGSFIIASQLPVSDWHAVFEDPTVADACLDRLIHNSYHINIGGETMRNRRQKHPGLDTIESEDLE